MLQEHYNAKTKTLILPFNFNEELKNLPPNTEIIIFEQNLNGYKCSTFNKSVDNLPNSLIHLTFGYSFNREVDNLPNSLTHLTFGKEFDQNVDNLPNNLRYLTFGYDFDKEVDNLPNSMTHLTFGFDFDRQVEHLPNSLTHLTFGYWFNQKVDNLPLTIKQIKIHKQNINLLKKIPFGCEIIDEEDKEIFI